MTVKWQLRRFLEQERITVYAVWKASGVSKSTLYAITNGHMEGVQFDTLAKLLTGIEQLRQRPVTLEEILEVIRDDPEESASRLEQPKS